MKHLIPAFLLIGLAAPAPAQSLRLPLGADGPDFVPRPVSSGAVWEPAVTAAMARRGPLMVVDGQPLPDSVDIPPAEDIIALRELEPAEAVKRYGPRAAHGALLIHTDKRRPRRPNQ
jgi:hypothetical protein